MESAVYNQEGKEVGKVTLPPAVFGVAWNSDMIHEVVTSMFSSRRHPVAHAKNRGEVRGGGKKPWRQKGTGRARHGSTRSPIWVGGGVTHGPRNDKNYSRKINKKTAAKALAAALSKKFSEGEILMIDALKFKDAKTKEAVSAVKALSSIKGFEMLQRKNKNALCLALPQNDAALKRSFRNIGNIEVLETRNLNVTDVLAKKYVAFVGPDASLKVLTERLQSA